MNVIRKVLLSSKQVQFVLLSFAGWCLDFVLFYAGVTLLSVPPAWSNIISSATAAMTVFLVSQRFIFDAQYVSIRSNVIYFVYTVSNIIVWSCAIAFLSSSISNALTLAGASSALIAKVVVTPLSLFCNFFVSRWVANRWKK